MALTRQQKEVLVANYTKRLEQSQATIFMDYCGLSVSDITKLRDKVRPVDSDIQVVKNTLAKIAIRNLGMEDPAEMLVRPTAMAYCQGDIAGAAKALIQFVKENNELEIKGGLLAGKVLSKDEVLHLSAIPSREVLLSKIVGGMQSPISGLVGVLSGPIRSLAYVLQARSQQLEEA